MIGAGLAGILTAFFLKEKGISCLVLEAEKTAGGNTQNTTGKITAQHGMIYHRLIQEQGEEKAREYASLNQKAVASYESLIDKKKINCDFQRVSSFLFTNLEKNLPKLKEEERAARKLGLHAVLTDTASLPFPCKGALCLPDQAQFHPLRFIRALAKELLVLENTRAESVYEKTETGDPGFPPPSAGRSGPGRYCVSTNQGEFWGEKIVFACQYPFLNIPGYYFLKMNQDRSYVLTLKKRMPLQSHRIYITASIRTGILSAAITIIFFWKEKGTGREKTKRAENTENSAAMPEYIFLTARKQPVGLLRTA